MTERRSFPAALPAENKDPERQAGFTLAELLVVLIVTGLLSSFFLSCFFTSVGQYRQRSARLELEENLTLASSFLTEEIAKSLAVRSCNHFRLELQQDVVVHLTLEEDPQKEEHYYRQIEGKNLYRREDTERNKQPMANFIRSLRAYYLDENGLETEEPEEVRAVMFVLTGRWQDALLERRGVVRLAGAEYL